MYNGPDQRTVYRRRQSKAHVTVRSVHIDNKSMVPTNLTLLRALKCHINVEVYQPLLGVKYLFSYLKKGQKGESIHLRINSLGEPAVTVCIEVRQYETHRYLSCYEADWRIRTSNVNSSCCSHNVVRLPVHLPSQQIVLFVEGGEEDALRSADQQFRQLESRRSRSKAIQIRGESISCFG